MRRKRLPPPSDAGTVALVTGASSGIGEQVARVLAARGYGLALVARRRERLEQLAAELGRAHGVRAEALGCDLADATARARLADELAARGLHVSVLVNNAGSSTIGYFASADRERELQVARLNVEAVLDLTHRFLGPMVERGRGAIVNICALAAFQPAPGHATYAASKAFELSLSEALHEELRSTGVTVTVVCPGPVAGTELPMVAGVGADIVETTPRAMRRSAAQIAHIAIAAADRGRRVVVPGAANHLMARFGRYAPRPLTLRLAHRLAKDMATR